MNVLQEFFYKIGVEQRCFDSLLVNFNFQDQECLKHLVTKCLSFGIIAGSCI
eukprot:Pgem_evm1s2437